MKKIINNPYSVVSDMLSGLAKANSELLYSPQLEVISRKTKSGKVGVISGGGAGHEPAHAGFVGDGMLDAAVSGNVFASPSPDRIIEGLHQADSGKGVLMIIKNYSGDIMNFQLAGEMAAEEGIQVEHVVVKDDVAVPDSTLSAGRRGIAGTIFVHKIAGAAAKSGLPLDEVKRLAQKAIDNVRSMGMAMSPCILPAVGSPGFTLEDDEMELGMGIHGEPGIRREPMVSAYEIAQKLLQPIFNDLNYENNEVALLVNGMGGTPLMELYILCNEAEKELRKANIQLHRIFVGNYMTSLEMSGCSLSLLRLDEELKHYLNIPCNTTALKIT